MRTANEIFTSVVKGNNFMTPNKISYHKIKNGAVELSSGTGFSGNTMYGVTVVQNGKHDANLSKCFYSKVKAMEYIESLK